MAKKVFKITSKNQHLFHVGEENKISEMITPQSKFFEVIEDDESVTLRKMSPNKIEKKEKIMMITPDSSISSVIYFINHKNKGILTDETDFAKLLLAPNKFARIDSKYLYMLKIVFPDDVITQEDILVKENAELKTELSECKARIEELRKLEVKFSSIYAAHKKGLLFHEGYIQNKVKEIEEAVKAAVGEK